MKYLKMEKYGEGKFRRITGVRRRTFEKMVSILREAEKVRRTKGDRSQG
jgi:hypothetical protein